MSIEIEEIAEINRTENCPTYLTLRVTEKDGSLRIAATQSGELLPRGQSARTATFQTAVFEEKCNKKGHSSGGKMQNLFSQHVEQIAQAVRCLPSCAIINRSSQPEVRVTGLDAEDFLHRLSTASLKALPRGAGRWTLFLDGKGHVKGGARVWRRPNGWTLDADPGQGEVLIRHLESFHIRERLEIKDESEMWRKTFLVGADTRRVIAELMGTKALDFPVSSSVLREVGITWPGGTLVGENSNDDMLGSPDPGETLWVRTVSGFPSEHFLLVFPTELAETVSRRLEGAFCDDGVKLWNWLRILAGWFIFGQDVDAERLGPEVTADKEIISLSKGCYPGQEVVARTVSRGHVNWRLRGLSFSAALNLSSGDELTMEGKKVGWITSIASLPESDLVIGLGYLRREWEAAGQTLFTDAGPVAVHSLPFLPSCL